MEKEKYKEINPSHPQGQGNALSLRFPVSGDRRDSTVGLQ